MLKEMTKEIDELFDKIINASSDHTISVRITIKNNDIEFHEVKVTPNQVKRLGERMKNIRGEWIE